MAEPSSSCESAVLMIAAITPVSRRPVKMGMKNASETTKYTSSGSKTCPSLPDQFAHQPHLRQRGARDHPEQEPEREDEHDPT